MIEWYIPETKCKRYSFNIIDKEISNHVELLLGSHSRKKKATHLEVFLKKELVSPTMGIKLDCVKLFYNFFEKKLVIVMQRKSFNF